MAENTKKQAKKGEGADKSYEEAMKEAKGTKVPASFKSRKPLNVLGKRVYK